MAQVFPEIRDGEHVTGDEELGVTLLADIGWYAAAEVRSAPGGAAPPLHVHAAHAEAFLVLAGELTFRLEDGDHRVGPETWVFVPPGVVHTFSVTGDAPARFLDLHAPSSGLGDFVRGSSTAFDQQPAPAEGGADPGLVRIVRAGGAEGERITDRPGRRATVLLDADELIVSEFAYGPGERGAEPHVHHEHADGFLVVEGEFTFALRDGPLALSAETFLFLPPEVVHGFDNESGENARCFNVHAPSAGFGDYLRGRNPGFDQHGPPADGGADPAAATVVRLPR